MYTVGFSREARKLVKRSSEKERGEKIQIVEEENAQSDNCSTERTRRG